MKLKQEERKRIESAVEAAEKKTSGEIVVMAVPQSDRYRWVHGVWASFGLIAATVVGLSLEHYAEFPLPFWELVGIQLVGAAAGAVFAFLPGVIRFTIPKRHSALRVHRESLANFLALGLTETRERTGVLVYISEMEHRVEILADSGIEPVCGRDYWDAQVRIIAEGLRDRRAVESIVKAVGNIGDKLADRFPRRADDTNELSNDVRTSPQDNE